MGYGIFKQGIRGYRTYQLEIQAAEINEVQNIKAKN